MSPCPAVRSSPLGQEQLFTTQAANSRDNQDEFSSLLYKDTCPLRLRLRLLIFPQVTKKCALGTANVLSIFTDGDLFPHILLFDSFTSAARITPLPCSLYPAYSLPLAGTASPTLSSPMSWNTTYFCATVPLARRQHTCYSREAPCCSGHFSVIVFNTIFKS